MNQEYVLVEHLNNINTIINRPLQFTQRIKFTCFDVSQNYIVFGASSGGLYVFNRFPHVFIKLIPSKEGAVVQVAISPNEKTVAIASVKGLIVIIENCFTNVNTLHKVYAEHEGNVVTAIKWNLHDVYCGDNKGNISVIMLQNLLTKAIFQPSSAWLMQLDSAIVQIDCYIKFLLISTNTRTYICNTDKEQYRQIGKKLRDGYFGACIFTSDILEGTSHASTSRGLFKNIKEDEQLLGSRDENVKIFCTRPGARMWEAKLDCSVTRTHQFKNILNQKSLNLLHLDDEQLDAHLKISKLEVTGSELFNFGKIFLFNDKFIFTFNSGGFYIFDIENTNLICWCNYFNNIKDVKIINKFIYIWNENYEIHIVGLYSLENIIIKSLFKKQYFITSELCINYMKEVLDLVEISDKIHLVSILEDKINLDLKEQLNSLFKVIKAHSEKKYLNQKLTSGIVIVNTLYGDNVIKSTQEKELPETLQTLKGIGNNVTDKLSESTKNFKEKLQIFEATVKNLTSDSNTHPMNKFQLKKTLVDRNETEHSIIKVELTQSQINSNNLKIFTQQYEINKINNKIELPKFKKILLECDLMTVVFLFKNFKEEKKEKNVDLWCYQNFLRHLMHQGDFERELTTVEIDDDVISFTREAFCQINSSPQYTCLCSFPLPGAKNKLPEFYEVGCELLKKFFYLDKSLFKEFHKEVPFFWKYIIETWKSNDDINDLLPLLIQFGDGTLIKIFLNKFKYDTWDDAVKLLVKLNKNICLNCDNNFENNCDDAISWTIFSKLMVQSIGGPSAINLLFRYTNFIPSKKLNIDFYQSCIFATIADNFEEGLRNQSIELTDKIQTSENTAMEFDKMVAAFLEKQPVKHSNGYIAKKTDLNCTSCNLPINIPLINNCVKLKCNHFYHLICLKCNGNVCKICEE